MTKCHACGVATRRVVKIGLRHDFECADCEYKRTINPDPLKAIRLPRERSKRLQKEQLWDVGP